MQGTWTATVRCFESQFSRMLDIKILYLRKSERLLGFMRPVTKTIHACGAASEYAPYQKQLK
jgi:hypothetical protein